MSNICHPPLQDYDTELRDVGIYFNICVLSSYINNVGYRFRYRFLGRVYF